MIRERWRAVLPGLMPSLRTARSAAPSRRTNASGSTLPLRKASARVCSASAVNSAAFRTFAAIVSDSARQPPSCAAKPDARSCKRRPSCERPSITIRPGLLLMRERHFAGRGSACALSGVDRVAISMTAIHSRTTQFVAPTLPRASVVGKSPRGNSIIT
jgi:hypothetical protein